jgi:DNA-binding beta-propeller fold protein YncE
MTGCGRQPTSDWQEARIFFDLSPISGVPENFDPTKDNQVTQLYSANSRFYFSWCAILAVALLCSACAPQAPPPRPRFFWPLAPDAPKIEFIDFYQTNYDINRGAEHWLTESIFGREKPILLFKRPYGVLADGKGRVYVSDPGSGQVVLLDVGRLQVGSLKNGEGGEFFNFPAGMALDRDGQLFLVESTAQVIDVFSPAGKYVRNFGGGQLIRPLAVAIDDLRDRVYVVDPGAHRIAVFTRAGAFVRHIGERGGSPGMFNFPLDIDLDAEGNLYILDSLNARVQVLDPEGIFLRAFGERGTARGSFQVPKGLAVSPSGQVYVTDSLASRIVIFDLEGRYLLTVGGPGVVTRSGVSPGSFYLPQGIDVDNKNAIWIVDSLNRMVHQFQFLDDQYLAKHPILPEEIFTPSGLKP